MNPSPTRHLFVALLAINIVLAPTAHIAFMPMPAGKGDAAIAQSELTSGGRRLLGCLNHRHGAQCAMFCFVALAVAEPEIEAPPGAPAFEVAVAAAATQSDITPTARDPPRA